MALLTGINMSDFPPLWNHAIAWHSGYPADHPPWPTSPSATGHMRWARRWSARWWPSIRGRPAAVTCTIAWRKLGTIDPARATEDKGYQNRLEEDEKVLAMSPHIYKPCPRLLHGERSFFETASSDRGLQLVELRLERRDLLLFRHDGGVNGRQLGQSSAGAV